MELKNDINSSVLEGIHQERDEQIELLINDILKNDQKGEEKFNKFCTLMAGFSVSSIGIACLGLFNALNPLTIIICLCSFVPSTALAIAVLQKREIRNMMRDSQTLNQRMNSIIEFDEKDHKITNKSVYFNQEIIKTFDKNIASYLLKQDIVNHINQLLYMINKNYYESINKKNPYTRRRLLEDVLNSLIDVMKETKEFNYDTINRALKNCSIISDKNRKKMVKEFKKAKCRKEDKSIEYRIISEDGETLLPYEREIATEEHQLALFDINNLEDIQAVYKAIILKNPEFSKIEIDFKIIQEMLSFIVLNFETDLEEYFPEFYHFHFVSSFLYQLLKSSCNGNNISASRYSVFEVLKSWDMLDWGLKNRILEKVSKEYNVGNFNEEEFTADYNSEDKKLELSFYQEVRKKES